MNPYDRVAAAICPPPSKQTISAILGQFDNLPQHIHPHQLDFYRELRRQTEQNFSAEALMAQAKVAAELSTGIGRENDTAVCEITELSVMQRAQGFMREIIMATPLVQNYARRQLIDAYAGLYVYEDPVEYTPVHMNRVYATVTNGVVTDSGGLRKYWSSEPLRELSTDEKTAALSTMRAVTACLLAGDDPTEI